MEDLKRLIVPAVIALLLHGVLVSFKLPNQQTVKPVLKGNPIQIEINTLKPIEFVPKKPEEHKMAEIIPDTLPRPKEVPLKKNSTPPIITTKQQKKVIKKPDRIEKKEVFKEKNNDIYLQHAQIENQVDNNSAIFSKSTVEKNFERELEENSSKEKKSIAPVYTKAMPMYRQNKQPVYPVMARRRGHEGKVLLSVMIDAKGLVSDVKIKRSSGHVSLDRAALLSVKSWLFTPATEGGWPVAMWVDVPIQFQLK